MTTTTMTTMHAPLQRRRSTTPCNEDALPRDNKDAHPSNDDGNNDARPCDDNEAPPRATPRWQSSSCGGGRHLLARGGGRCCPPPATTTTTLLLATTTTTTTTITTTTHAPLRGRRSTTPCNATMAVVIFLPAADARTVCHSRPGGVRCSGIGRRGKNHTIRQSNLPDLLGDCGSQSCCC
jgi:hypothetical protein